MSQTTATTPAMGEFLDIDITRIRPYEGQPRRHFDKQGLIELADSLKEVGQQTPIVVKRIGDDPAHDFELTAGERRWQAAPMAGFKTLRAEVREFASATAQFEASMAENGAREDLSTIEWARGIDQLYHDPKYAHLSSTKRYEAIGKICGHSLSWAMATHVLTRLHPKVQAMIEPGAEKPIKVALAKELANYIPADHALQLKIAKIAQTRELTMNQARVLMRVTAQAEGKTDAIREKRPYQTRRNVESMVESIGRDCTHLLATSGPEFRRAMVGRPAGEGQLLLETLDKTIMELSQVRQAIARALPDTDKSKTSQASA